MYKDLKCKRKRSFVRNDRVRVRNSRANKTDKGIPGTIIKVCGPRTYVVRTGHKIRYVHTDHMIRAHDNVPDDVSEPDVVVPESSGQKIHDDNVNPLDSTSEPRVDLPENKDTVVSPLVVSSPPTVLRRSQRIRNQLLNLTCNCRLSLCLGYKCILKIWGKVVQYIRNWKLC